RRKSASVLRGSTSRSTDSPLTVRRTPWRSAMVGPTPRRGERSARDDTGHLPAIVGRRVKIAVRLEGLADESLDGGKDGGVRTPARHERFSPRDADRGRADAAEHQAGVPARAVGAPRDDHRDADEREVTVAPGKAGDRRPIPGGRSRVAWRVRPPIRSAPFTSRM